MIASPLNALSLQLFSTDFVLEHPCVIYALIILARSNTRRRL